MFGFSREFEEDPFFSMHNMHRQHMHQMEQMMRDPLHSVFSHHHNPMLSLPLHGNPGNSQQQLVGVQPRLRPGVGPGLGPGLALMSPFGGGFGGMFAGMDQMIGNMQQQMQNGSAHSFSQSSVMTYSNTGNGQPHVYQATSSTRQAPGGVKETRKSVRDSQSGLEKMSVGHHIKDRAHIVERSRNRQTGDEDENQDYVNIDEDEAEAFNQEWKQKAHVHSQRAGERTRLERPRPHAITDGRRNHHSGTPYRRH